MYLLKFVVLLDILSHIVYDLLSSQTLLIFCNHSRVRILFLDFCKRGNVNTPTDFFHFFKSFCQTFIVLFNTLLHFRHDLLSSGSFASFERPPMSVS